MTYLESAQLMNDLTFRSRIKVACLKYADYILDEASNTPAHNTRVKWATAVFYQPDVQAGEIQPVVVMDPSVQEQGADIDDAALQDAVETAVNAAM